jgi:high-affinity iron transporter
LIASTYLLFLIGAGLFSKCIGFFEYYVSAFSKDLEYRLLTTGLQRFAKAVGGDVAETGNGPGSYQVAGNVWHLTYGNPETGAVGTNGGWQIFNAIFGWNNNASIGTILGYCLYWIAIMVSLIYIKWSEGRVTFFGRGSKAYHRMEARKLERATNADLKASPASPSVNTHRSDSDHSSEDGKQKLSEEQHLPTGVVLGRVATLHSGSSDSGDLKA